MDGETNKAGGQRERVGRVVVIAGPTASGKSGLAAKLAARLGGFVVNADSRQVYAELDVGVAKPTAAQRALATHYLVGYRRLEDVCSAGAWAREARAVIEAGLAERRSERNPAPTAVVVGGTGLYVRALLEGIPDMPGVAPAIAERLEARLRREGIDALLAELDRLDPVYGAHVDRRNGRRITRALAVMEAGDGRTFTELRAQRGEPLGLPVHRILLEPDRDELYGRIDARVDDMVASGLEEEARRLYPRRALRSLATIGYREWWPTFAGERSREAATADIKRATRHYARRQLTWNRRLEGLRLADPDVEAALAYLAGDDDTRPR